MIEKFNDFINESKTPKLIRDIIEFNKDKPYDLQAYILVSSKAIYKRGGWVDKLTYQVVYPKKEYIDITEKRFNIIYSFLKKEDRFGDERGRYNIK